MKEDRDLQFLASCPSSDLKTLVDMMTFDKNGNVRISEQLTDTDAYLRYYPGTFALHVARDSRRVTTVWRKYSRKCIP